MEAYYIKSHYNTKCLNGRCRLNAFTANPFRLEKIFKILLEGNDSLYHSVRQLWHCFDNFKQDNAWLYRNGHTIFLKKCVKQ